MSTAGTSQQVVAEVVVDNPQAEFTGTWTNSSFQPHLYGTDYAYTNRNAVSQVARVVRWRPALATAGDYAVSVWLPDGNGDRADAVTYRVRHGGQESVFVLDQTVAGGYWRQLGRGPLAFTGSGDEYVELRVADVAPKPNGAATYVQADAVRFAPPPPPLASGPQVDVVAGRNYAELSWPTLDGASSYVVRRALAGQQPEEVAEVVSAGYLDLSLDSRSDYVFTVAGVNGAGLGPSSRTVRVRYAAGAPLEAVQGLVVTGNGPKAVLQWQPSLGATGYRIEKATRSGRAGQVIATVTGTTFIDVPPGPQAYYVVRSTNAAGTCALGSWQVAWLRA
ncbi:hypothetical protein JOF29_007292 [Kribbella aluminosa]|uniref:Fibronectin type-III domain-containing protein n=1 Tax=Kribbella aluminosa TaxID=416017 RepID=A0ABS4UX10_9ACTN|nr:hypothetical protein [Kribbella aluminosa]MBP2356182.1 hypothetical protein [Kribbella aluminosa]